MIVLKYIENLKAQYGGKNLPEQVRKEAIEIYKNNIPGYFKLSGDRRPLVTFNYILLAEGYDEIIFDDYGAFAKVDEKDICWENLTPKINQTKSNSIIYEVDNYPNFECIYKKYNPDIIENSYLLIPIYKIVPVQDIQ